METVHTHYCHYKQAYQQKPHTMRCCYIVYVDLYTCISLFYTSRFYFPYLSLLAQPVNITLYGPGLDCLVFDSVPERYLHYYFR